MITEKELKDIGFELNIPTLNMMELHIREADRISIRIRHELNEHKFLLITLSDWKHDWCELKINTIQDLKKVIKRLKELSEFMV